MKAQYLGHVVFYVKDLEQSLAFYRDLLGFQEVGSIFNGAAAALTSGRTQFIQTVPHLDPNMVEPSTPP